MKAVYFLLGLLGACGTTPEEVHISAPTTSPVSAPASVTKKERPKACQELLSLRDAFCATRQGDAVCNTVTAADPPEDSTEEKCIEVMSQGSAFFRAMHGTSPWPTTEAKLPQTYSPEKLPKDFVHEGDGLERVEDLRLAPFLSATASITFVLPRFKSLQTLDGSRVGFRLMFFTYQSDMDLAQKAQSGWTLQADNLLIAMHRLIPMEQAFAQEMAKGLGAKAIPPKSELPGLIDISTMAKAYQENEIKADAAYKGKRIIGGGRVDRVRRNIAGDPYLWFKPSGAGLFDASCRFPKEREADLMVLEEDMGAIIEGTVEGKGPIEVQIVDCSLLGYGKKP